jgi:DNA polymerase I-like protein with 3'-5' exonuclease and polymerase domains
MPIVRRDTFDDVVAKFSATGLYAVDTETTGLRAYLGDRLFSIIIAGEAGSFYFNFQKYPGLAEAWVLGTEHLAKLQLVFSNDSSTFAMHNAKFDLAMLAREGLQVRGRVHCTEATARVLYNRHMTYSLDACAEREGLAKSKAASEYIKKHRLYTDIEVEGGKVERQPHYDRLPFPLVSEYGIIDGEITYRLAKKQLEDLATLDHSTPSNFPSPLLVYENEVRLTKTCFKIETVGVKIDRLYCRKALEFERSVAAEAVGAFEKLSGETFKDSAFPLAKAFDAVGETYPRTKPTKSRPLGTPSFTDDVLAGFASPMARHLRTYRGASKKANTYYANFLRYADDADRIHANMRQAGTDTGRFSYSEPNCISMDTEVLTFEGWCDFSSLNENSQVACFDQISGSIVFERPLKKWRSFDKRKVLRFYNQHFDMLITPEHRCLFKDRRNDKLKTVPAREFLKDTKVLHGAQFPSSGSIFDNEAILRLLIAVQADGSFPLGRQIIFTLSKKRKIDRLRVLLQACKIEFKEMDRAHHGTTTFCFRKDLALFQGCLNDKKCFTTDLLKLSALERDIFLSELRLWDGTSTREPIEYYSNKKINVDIVQAIASLDGRRALIRDYRNKKGGQCFIVNITNRDYSLTANTRQDETTSEVWCLEVPTSYFLARRNDKTFITGNCQNLPKEENQAEKFLVRRAFVPTDKDWCFVMIDYKAMEFRLMLDYVNEKGVIRQIIEEGLDVHEATAKQMGVSRQEAKTLNFLLLYGGGAARLADALGITENEGKSLKRTYFSKLPNISAWTKLVQERAGKLQLLRNWMGRRYHFPYIDSPTYKGHLEHAGPNHLVQGGCADVVKVSMNRIDDFLEKYLSRMLAQVHDELLFEIHRTELDIVPQLVKIMESAYPYKHLPLTCDVAHSWVSWADKVAGYPT